MKSLNQLEEIYADLDLVGGLGLIDDDDPDIVGALNEEAGSEFSVIFDDGEVNIFGNTVDEGELVEAGLSIRTVQSAQYYASYSQVLPADLMK